MIMSFVIWYVAGGDGVPAGVIVLLFVVVFVELYFLLKMPRFIPVVLITMVTQVRLLCSFLSQCSKKTLGPDPRLRTRSKSSRSRSSHIEWSTLLSNLRAGTLPSRNSRSRLFRRLHLALLPLPRHRTKSTPEGSWRITLPASEILQCRTYHGSHTSKGRCGRHFGQELACQETRQNPQQAVLQRDGSARRSARTFLIRSVRIHSRWQIPQSAIRLHHQRNPKVSPVSSLPPLYLIKSQLNAPLPAASSTTWP